MGHGEDAFLTKERDLSEAHSPDDEDELGQLVYSSLFYTVHASQHSASTDDAKASEVGNICRGKILVTLPNKAESSDVMTKELAALEDPGGSKNIAQRELLHNVKPAHEYGLPPISMTTIDGQSPWYREAGELHFTDETSQPIVILCYVQDAKIPGHSDFVLISNNTLVDLEADMNYQMKVSRDEGIRPGHGVI